MPDIDPAAVSRSGSGSQPTSFTPLIVSKTVSVSAPPAAKPTKALSLGQRIDLEPLYTALKSAIGEHWVAYKEAISLFVLGAYPPSCFASRTLPIYNILTVNFADLPFMSGHLNQSELSSRIAHIFGSDVNKEHLHNQLLAAIYGNVTRDLPDHGVANWVAANDKPTNVSKPVSGDAAEQRLKMEVMQLPARDRRRLKDIPDVCVRSHERVNWRWETNTD